MKATIDQLIFAANTLAAVKVSGLESADRLALVGVMRHLRPVAEEYEAAMNDLRVRLAPEGFEEYAQKAPSELTEAQAQAARRYAAEMNAAVHDLLCEEREAAFKPLSAEAMERVAPHLGDIDLTRYMMLSDLLCGGGAESALTDITGAGAESALTDITGANDAGDANSDGGKEDGYGC